MYTEISGATMDKILEVALHTGSHAYGLAEYEDLDYVLTLKETSGLDFISTNKLAASAEYQEDDHLCTSVKVKYLTMVINVVIVKDKATKEHWQYATETMAKFVKKNPKFKNLIKDKETRIILFRTFYDIGKE